MHLQHPYLHTESMKRIQKKQAVKQLLHKIVLTPTAFSHILQRYATFLPLRLLHDVSSDRMNRLLMATYAGAFGQLRN